MISWVRANYHVTTEPMRAVVAGSSYGGLAATFTAHKYPGIFGNVLSQSGSFWWYEGFDPAERPPDAQPGWLIRQFVFAETSSLRFYMNVGLLENREVFNLGVSQLGINRHMRNVLQAKGYPVTYVEYSGGHDYLSWQQTLADGLIVLLGRWRYVD